MSKLPSASPSKGAPLKTNEKEVRAALTQLRKKLLDLTARNPLISFKHGKSSRYIRIVDELPDQLTEQLYNGKTLKFSPVPDPGADELELWKSAADPTGAKRPTVEAWAAQCGISVSLDLPAETGKTNLRQHQDLKVQTPYYPKILEARLAGITKLANTTIQETGTNFLHMVFGFLEWYESADSTKAHHAPLYIIPVRMEKGAIDPQTNTYQYTLALDSEEIQFNASLAAKLKEEHGFVLPELDQEMWPDAYLAEVAEKIRAKFPLWKVRRWSTITILNFSRLLMYRDLDPANWPEDRSLATHPLVGAVIAGEAQSREIESESATYGSEPEHAIDEIADIHEHYPLVDVADSSQHSALIDALDGKNLVIQGPPGTGKSQTITNLIAAALNQGKTVLFVSEKMAALDVVSQRMERLGLGLFCLELHSHTTQKIGVIESLRNRYMADFKSPRRLDEEAASHTELRDRLRHHAALVNKVWKTTGKTIHEILTGAVRYRHGLQEELLTLRVQFLSGKTWDPMSHATLQRELRAFHGQVRKIAADTGCSDILSSHPWRGLTNTDLDTDAIEELVGLLTQWRNSLAQLSSHTAALPESEPEEDKSVTLRQVHELSKGAAALPASDESTLWSSLIHLNRTGMEPLDQLVRAIHDLEGRTRSTGRLTFEQLLNFPDLTSWSAITSELLEAGMHPGFVMADLRNLGKTCEGIRRETTIWQGHLSEYGEGLPGQVPDFLSPQRLSLESLRILSRVIRIGPMLPSAEHGNRKAALLPSQLKQRFQDFSHILVGLQQEREHLAAQFNLVAARQCGELDQLVAQVPPLSPLKRFFSGTYRKAIRALRTLASLPKTKWDPGTIQRDLAKLSNYLRREAAFMKEPLWQDLFGNHFKGVDTDLTTLTTLVSWHAQVEEEFSSGDEGIFRDRKLGEPGVWLLEASTSLLQKLPLFEQAGLQNTRVSLTNDLQRLATAYGLPEFPTLTLLEGSGDVWNRRALLVIQSAGNMPEVEYVIKQSAAATLQDARETQFEYFRILQDWNGVLRAYRDLNAEVFGGWLPAIPLPTEKVLNQVVSTRQWVNWLKHPETPERLQRPLLAFPSADTAESLLQWGVLADQLLNKEAIGRGSFADISKLNSNLWRSEDPIHELVTRAEEAISGDDLLLDFTSYLRQRIWLHENGLTGFPEAIEKLHLSPVEQLTRAHEHAVYARAYA